MTKNDFFSTSRFVSLCRKSMVENWRTNLLRIVMLYGVMALYFVIRGYFSYKFSFGIDPMVSQSLQSFLTFGWIFGCLQASVTFDKMKTKTSRLSMLMTPATPFEKYFSGWLISTIVFVVVFVIAFVLADYTRVLVCGLVYPESTITPASLKYLVSSGAESGYHLFYEKSSPIFANTIRSYFFFQSFFLLGSAVWPKNSFIKTFVAGLVIMVSYSLVAAGSIYLFIDHSTFALNFVMNGGDRIIIIIVSLFTLLNWTLAYYRFKESEIINRM